MTSALEHRLRAVFLADADKAPPLTGLAAAARLRARAERRRHVGVVAAGLLAAACAAAVAPALLATRERSVVAVGTPDPGPLTRADCPNGINGTAPPFVVPFAVDDGQPVLPAEERARIFGDRLIKPRYPTAVLYAGQDDHGQRVFVFTDAAGHRVGRVAYQEVRPGAWQLVGGEYC
jgi:hypothetical protein